MNYENLSKEELIELLKQSHEHVYKNNIDTKNKKLKRVCDCGTVKEFDLTLIETPLHTHKFKYTELKTTFNADTTEFNVKIAVCQTCGEKRCYLDNNIDINQEDIDKFMESPKYELKECKTEIFYPKKLSVIAFYGPTKAYMSKGYWFYIKSDKNKWYKANEEIAKYIIEHFSEWTDETEILFNVVDKHIV